MRRRPEPPRGRPARGGAKAAAASWLGFLAAGCATLERGTDDRLAVVSNPPGATATRSSGPSCITPCSLEVGRREEFTVTIAKNGFTPQVIPVTTRISDAGAGFFMENVVTAGLGGGVDVATGATLEHSPNPVSVTLVAAPPPVPKR